MSTVPTFKARNGFTLAEVLVSILIFMIISGAMFGIFLSVTQLYREGEFSRSSNDESQIVTNLLERDLARAVPAQAGGVFYAWLDVHSSNNALSNGNCAVGWVIRNPQQNDEYPNPFVFVLWGKPHEANEPLRRAVFDIDRDLNNWQLNNASWTDIGPDPDVTTDDTVIGFNANNPLASLGSQSQEASTISQHCLQFSASLTGTAHDISGAFTVCHKPSLNAGATNPTERTTYWSYVTDGTLAVTDEPNSEPSIPGQYYSNQQTLTIGSDSFTKTYPNAVRFTMVLSGNERFSKNGRLQADLNASDTSYLRMVGIDSFASTQGSLIRVGNNWDTYEWIGYHAYDDNGLKINSSWEHGPCMPTGGSGVSGRGVLKSMPQDHSAGDQVRIGHLLTLTRTLPQ